MHNNVWLLASILYAYFLLGCSLLRTPTRTEMSEQKDTVYSSGPKCKPSSLNRIRGGSILECDSGSGVTGSVYGSFMCCQWFLECLMCWLPAVPQGSPSFHNKETALPDSSSHFLNSKSHLSRTIVSSTKTFSFKAL